MSDDNIIETYDRYRVRLEIEQDSDSSNPRTNQDNLTNVITMRGQRYINVDEDGGPLADGWWRSHDRYVDAFPVFERWARIFHGATVVHHQPYDGAEALWYVMPDKAAESTVSPEEIIESEIQEYRAWAEGDVWGYVIERKIAGVPKDGQDPDDSLGEMTTWHEEESCWGYIGREYAEEAAREAFAYYKEK